MSNSKVYSQGAAIAEFFNQTYATPASCDCKALDLVGGEEVVPVEVQGVFSYTVYAGPQLEYVVQFRLRSLKLDTKTAALAAEVYGSLAPTVKLYGELGLEGAGDGDEVEAGRDNEKEPLLVYVMDRIRGLTHLNFILKDMYPQNSKANFAARKNLMTDIARYVQYIFMALSWNSPQQVSPSYRTTLLQTYTTDLRLLLTALPTRFHAIIQSALDHLDSVFSLLPMVLLHPDFGTSNILVDEKACHLTGVIDWAEAVICPFGQNLHSLEAFTGALHMKHGWKRYDDYRDLHVGFWETFASEVGNGELNGLTRETKEAIEMSRVVGLLRAHGFTKGLGDIDDAVPRTPISDDGRGRYNLLFLDGLLLEPETRFIGLL